MYQLNISHTKSNAPTITPIDHRSIAWFMCVAPHFCTFRVPRGLRFQISLLLWSLHYYYNGYTVVMRFPLSFSIFFERCRNDYDCWKWNEWSKMNCFGAGVSLLEYYIESNWSCMTGCVYLRGVFIVHIAIDVSRELFVVFFLAIFSHNRALRAIVNCME